MDEIEKLRRSDRSQIPGKAVTDFYATFGRLRHRHARLDRVLRRTEAEAEELSRRTVATSSWL